MCFQNKHELTAVCNINLETNILSIFQLLDLMHTLHTRANSIYSSWAEEGGETGEGEGTVSAASESLWIKCWCPLLQGKIFHVCDIAVVEL